MEKLVYLLTTGGTIGSSPTNSGLVVVGGNKNDPTNQIRVAGTRLILKNLLQKGSANFVPSDWVLLARTIAKVLRRHTRVSGIVVTHGTDTMPYTAAALSFMLRNLCTPIVLTGSMIPGAQLRSDALANLEDAVKVAAFSDLAEVCVVFSADSGGNRRIIIRGSRARKVNSRALNAFESINVQPIGYVENGKIKYTDLPRFRRVKRKLQVSTELETNVVMIKQNPALTPEMLRRFLSYSAGAVIEGTGSGRVNESLLEVIRSFERPVALSTQTVYGGENLGAYELDKRILKVRNIIPTHDMISEAAFVKLMWVLGQKLPVKSTMLKSVCGEITA